MDCTNKFKIVYGDVTLGVLGEGFHYIFSYQYGGLESLVIEGKEWLYRTPKPTFWRAMTDNDRGSGFGIKSGMWLSADMFMTCKDIEIAIDGERVPQVIAPFNNRFIGDETANELSISFIYETITAPKTEVKVKYDVTANGEIKVHVHYFGKEGLPELPVFGMRFVVPTAATGYTYEGLSGETYPDRMAGGKLGVYHVEGLPITQYLVPQDCNVHMETKWLEIYRSKTLNNADKDEVTTKIRFSQGEKPFAFSCIPYTAEELENATHHEELPLARRTVVSILGAVRGVGGINSWGADVEDGYRISGEHDIVYSFIISR